MEADELAGLLKEWADDNGQLTGAAYDENTFFLFNPSESTGEEKFVVIVAKVSE